MLWTACFRARWNRDKLYAVGIMARATDAKRKSTGGLHINMLDGQHIDIKKDGEILRIHFHGKNGLGYYQISCVGSKNFLIERPQKADNKTNTEGT